MVECVVIYCACDPLLETEEFIRWFTAPVVVQIFLDSGTGSCLHSVARVARER